MTRYARVLVEVVLEYRIPIDDEVLDVNVELEARSIVEDGHLGDYAPVGVWSGPDVVEAVLESAIDAEDLAS